MPATTKTVKRQYKSLIENQRNENGNQHHPEDGEQVWDSNNPGGH